MHKDRKSSNTFMRYYMNIEIINTVHKGNIISHRMHYPVIKTI